MYKRALANNDTATLASMAKCYQSFRIVSPAPQKNCSAVSFGVMGELYGASIPSKSRLALPMLGLFLSSHIDIG